jgi:general secretion pathway protein D
MNPIPTIRRLTACLLLLALSSCAFAPWPKEGVSGATPDERVANASAAQQKQPEDMPIRRDLHVARENAVYELFADAERALRENRKSDAEAIYGRVLAIDPSNPRALAGQRMLKREREHAAILAEAQALFDKGSMEAAQGKLHQILLVYPEHAGALSLQDEIRRKQAATSRSEPPRLKPPFDKPITLELRDANIKMVFEALSRTTGINFILDKDIKQDAKATVFIKKARIEDAIEMVLATNGLQKKALSDTSALVFPNNAQKLKEYQDLVIRSFYFTNASAKQVAMLLKTMLKTKDVYVDERLNMLVIRDTPEVVRIAEKLVAANDMADPEVMLEIEVLEVTRSRLQDLGIQYPTGLSVTTTTLEALHNITAKNVNVAGNLGVDFKKTTGDVNLLANPRIRVRNNEKAKVLVGDKVPVITSNVTGTAATVSESIQYIDVGLKLDVEPRVTLDDHVNIKVALEVSSLGDKTTTTSGTVAYTIGTRNASTILRLKDGETQVLAGLISDDERKTTSRLPGLGDLPLLGRLFSTQEDKRNKTEIVLAITPRILGNINRPEAEISEYWSGTESGITDRPQIVVPDGSVAGRSLRAQPQPPQPEPEPAPEVSAAEPPKDGTASPEPTQPAANAVMPDPEQPKPIIDPAAPPAGL